MSSGSQGQLDREIELLRERLEGAEEMRRALVSEELDGFVVGHGERSPHVVLLETSAVATRPLLEGLPHSAVTVASSGEILYANQRFADRLGRSLAGLFSTPIGMCLAVESRTTFESFLAAAVPDSSCELILMHRDGRRLASRAAMMGIGNGHVSLLITETDTPQNADEARDALQAIHSGRIDGVVVGGEEVVLVSGAHNAYRVLVDRMQQGAVTVSLQGDVLYANDRFAAMVGRSRESLLGRSLASVLGSDIANHVLRADPQHDVPSEVSILHADGGPVRVGITAQRVAGADALTLVLDDLTERDRHLEMQERSRRNDRFLAVLAHELRNPLGAVRNAVQILTRSRAFASDDRFAIDVISRQSETLVRLVDDLLDVQRLNEDKIVLRRARVDLRAVIESSVAAARPIFAAKHQAVAVTLPGSAVNVDADVVRLAQVLGNILVNASKFTPVGGHVRVLLDRTGPQNGAEAACIRVVDDGTGVVPDLLEKIFEPYTQAPHDGEAFPEGLGLGLSVARRLVHLHGGTIVAHSKGIGHGTTLEIELPICGGAPDATRSARAEARPLPPLRILIADDDEDSAASLARLLELSGHETWTARSGGEALARADEVRPDVVILDIGMPRMDGWSAGRLLRERPWADSLVVYALSGWGQEQARQRSRDAGFDRHFAKPLDFDELARDLSERFARD